MQGGCVCGDGLHELLAAKLETQGGFRDYARYGVLCVAVWLSLLGMNASLSTKYFYMAPNDLANLMIVGGAALCSLLMVALKGRYTQIYILWGLWKCDRAVSNKEFDEEAANNNENENDNP